MRYGVPYMGSKNSIAEFIVYNLPSAENFYDLFCGGCAITHRALIENRWKNYYLNDIEQGVPQLFVDAVNGKYAHEKQWVSRDDFFRLKGDDAYIRLIWSFGNNGHTYLYSKEIEPWKRALHYARVIGDYSLLRDMGISGDGSISDIKNHYTDYRSKYIKWLGTTYLGSESSFIRLEHLERLQSLEHLQRLQSPNHLHQLQSLERLQRLQSLEHLQRLQSMQAIKITNLSYEQVKIKPNSVIYCDIPYENTTKYCCGAFDHKRFYEWAAQQTESLFISSYAISDERFVEIETERKSSLMNSVDIEKRAFKQEKLFVPKQQAGAYKEKRPPRTLFELL